MNKIKIITGIVMLSFSHFVFGVTYGKHMTTQYFHKELIEKGLARYSETTGQWEYKPKKVEVEIPVNTDVLHTASLFDGANLPLPEKSNKRIAKNK